MSAIGARLGGRAAVAARIAATDELAACDGHWLAGLLDAEGHFSIMPNNGGRNWLCSVHVRMRRDDVALLDEYRELTGLGTINPVPARRTSRPQACWSISNGLECLRLAHVLERFPLRGRKRRDAEIWTAAVREQASQPPGRADLQEHQTRIRLARRYVDPGRCSPPPATEAPGFVWYLGGFFTGEGSFHLSRSCAKARVKLRRDDRPLLLALAQKTGLGRVYDLPAYEEVNPSVLWVISAHGELSRAMDLLAAARLQGRKRREFRAWCVGAEEFVCARRDGRRRDHSRIDIAGEALRDIRRYRDVEVPIVDDHAARRQVFIDVLRAFAASSPGAVSCRRYSAARWDHPEWPNRNTIVRAFGSWFAALEAAGLAGRAHARSRRASEPAARPSPRRRPGPGGGRSCAPDRR